MIRVNLASPRKSRKRLFVVRQLIVAGILVAVELAFMGSLWLGQGRQMGRLRGQIGQANSELGSLRKVVSQMKELEKLNADLQTRLQVIDNLRQSQKGPITLLDLVSRSLPETLWLTSLGQKNTKVEIQGYSLNEVGIANFMKNLQASPDLVRVDLIASRQEVIERRKVQQFKIEATQKLGETPQAGPNAKRFAPGRGPRKATKP